MTPGTHRITEPTEESIPGMVPYLVDRILRDSAARNVSNIIIKRHRRRGMSVLDERDLLAVDSQRLYSHMTVEVEYTDPQLASASTLTGSLQEIASPPIYLWNAIIARLKVLARMPDYGLQKSTSGTIVLHDDDETELTFVLENNPNPFIDTEVVIKVGDRVAVT